MRNSRYDGPLDPVDIYGCCDVSAVAPVFGIKSHGGSGDIFTEQCEIHHSLEIAPFNFQHFFSPVTNHRVDVSDIGDALAVRCKVTARCTGTARN